MNQIKKDFLELIELRDIQKKSLNNFIATADSLAKPAMKDEEIMDALEIVEGNIRIVRRSLMGVNKSIEDFKEAHAIGQDLLDEWYEEYKKA